MILVIVDMQPHFTVARCRRLQYRIRRMIQFCNQSDHPVMVVEYADSGETYPAIIKHAEKNRRWRNPRLDMPLHVVKHEDDGGYGVVEVARRMGLGRHKTFMVCGVNTGYCVLGTARGILKARRDARVLLPVFACRTWYDNEDHRTTEQLIHNFVQDHPRRTRMVWDHESVSRTGRFK